MCFFMFVRRTEIFSGKTVTHDDISYEQACILYNLGELYHTKQFIALFQINPVTGSNNQDSNAQKIISISESQLFCKILYMSVVFLNFVLQQRFHFSCLNFEVKLCGHISSGLGQLQHFFSSLSFNYALLYNKCTVIMFKVNSKLIL